MYLWRTTKVLKHHIQITPGTQPQNSAPFRCALARMRDVYPIPRVADTLDALQEAKFVSTLDLRSGYRQVELDSESKEKTAFIMHKGLFQFNFMP
ncbi:unnamed protein product [Didymodactylos carnosus]|uniref:Pol-like protein n=1 Tax=Didymodactylos carnosus TaxID=1234261 RepID=A0A815U6C2_9BILA|nr:unnamed protein product [Didymodactylos carnosus]CAF1513417.1 unnamed protein product [Didymodactylos carnosus]CAF4139754.1 unnamed protein product [Didymodactylos carnosus]CAF4373771.1 unnamed protein product [Didymodactylos carnosus]